MRCYGENRVYQDYADDPPDPASDLNIDPDGYCERHWNSGYPYLRGKDAVVGHLWIRKYDRIEADVRATVLREPLSRALSQYYYWTSVPRSPHPVHRYILDNRLNFLSFLRLPTVRWIYSRIFFRGVDMKRFDYIIDYARLERDWGTITSCLGIVTEPPQQHLNETTSLVDDYLSKTQKFMGEPKKVAIARGLLADDMRFYERYAR